ncbi:MAG TPA: LD-carboxypeptidase, partial [Fibrella sp.]
SHLQRLGIASLHAIMPRQFRLDDIADDVESLRQWLFGEHVEPYAAPPHLLNRTGSGVGTLTGGNLSMLMHTLGTSSEVDWSGQLLFIEDIDETIFSLDRMMIQLRRSGKLANLAGLLVGTFSGMRDNATSPSNTTPEALIAEAVADYTYPVAFGMPLGHEGRNLALPVGISGTLTVGQEGSQLVFQGSSAM